MEKVGEIGGSERSERGGREVTFSLSFALFPPSFRPQTFPTAVDFLFCYFFLLLKTIFFSRKSGAFLAYTVRFTTNAMI